MVVPIGETANKFTFQTSFSTTILSNNQQTLLPSMNISNNTEMDHSTGTNPVNNNNARGRSPQSYKNLSTDTSMSSTISSTIYHERMEMNNGMDIDSDQLVDFPALSYKNEREKQSHLRKAAETINNMRPEDGINEAFSIQANHGNHVPSDSSHVQTPRVDDNNVINIQLPYDPNGPTESDLWSGNFQSISLYGSVKHIASDLKNIKQSLNFIMRYISNKKDNPKSSNDLNDFDSIGDMV